MFLSRPNESLENHVSELLRQYKILDKNKGLDLIIDNIIRKLCTENNILIKQQNIIKALFLENLKYHDEGKKNPYFQSFIGNNEYRQYKYTQINKHHSEISAIYYCITMYSEYVNTVNSKKKRPIQEFLKDIILSFAYNIYRHHCNLEDLDKTIFIEKLINYYKNNKEQFVNIDCSNIEFLNRFKNRSKIKYTNEYTYYLLSKLSYSILVTCDFMAVYKHNNGNLEINIIDDNVKNNIENKFNNNEVIKSIRQFQNNPNIPLSKLNRYRTEMFLESECNLMRYKHSNIFYLEAPTGCGKSLTSLNLALNLLNNTTNKIYYVAPFNNISEQTHKVIQDSFYENVVTINSKESIFISEDDDENIDYDKDFLNSQLINYPISLISHVKFFEILFSNNRFKNLMLSTLCNSVIIIDEIQSYKNKLWIHIINTFKEFAEMLNIKLIIMSATLPKMDVLLDDNTYKIPDLITNREYYYNFFKQRVQFDFSLLKKDKNDKQEIYSEIDKVINNTNKHRILIECLTTKTAETFYNDLKKYENQGFLVFKMTGLTNSINRQYIIQTIQSKINKNYKYKKIILIGTQCIEAGIDIDMQIGFKDISILDADEQFAGRIERNFNDTGTVYFYDINDGNFIYKGDFRTEKNLKNDEWKIVFQNKQFNEFYNRNYKWLLEKEYNIYKEFKVDIGELQYIKIKNTMRLIDSNTYSFLFLCEYENKNKAKDLLDIYLNINKSKLNYSEKKIKLIKIRKEISSYTYNINTYKFKNDVLFEKIGDAYIVEDGSVYFDNLKDNKLTLSSSLDLEKFVASTGLFI